MNQEDKIRILGLEKDLVLAITLWGEARGEGIEGKIAVAFVILNRSIDKRWPDTIQEVCIQPKQFSAWNDNDLNFPELIRKSKQGKFYDRDPVWKECLWTSHGVLSTWVRDLTHGANHYCVTRLNPSWADESKITVVIGNHKFFRL
jgi:N-acetylmuramoyl-L-alanine amidase